MHSPGYANISKQVQALQRQSRHVRGLNNFRSLQNHIMAEGISSIGVSTELQ